MYTFVVLNSIDERASQWVNRFVSRNYRFKKVYKYNQKCWVTAIFYDRQTKTPPPPHRLQKRLHSDWLTELWSVTLHTLNASVIGGRKVQRNKYRKKIPSRIYLIMKNHTYYVHAKTLRHSGWNILLLIIKMYFLHKWCLFMSSL